MTSDLLFVCFEILFKLVFTPLGQVSEVSYVSNSRNNLFFLSFATQGRNLLQISVCLLSFLLSHLRVVDYDVKR